MVERKEMWMVFSLDGKELCRWTLRGTFPGEIEETKELLAYENKVTADDIQIAVVKSY